MRYAVEGVRSPSSGTTQAVRRVDQESSLVSRHGVGAVLLQLNESSVSLAQARCGSTKISAGLSTID